MKIDRYMREHIGNTKKAYIICLVIKILIYFPLYLTQLDCIANQKLKIPINYITYKLVKFLSKNITYN